MRRRHERRILGSGHRRREQHPSHPSSIASAASDAVPTPASRMTGTSASDTISSMLWGFWMPRPLPIGDPSGITAAQPIRCNRRASTGSSFVYGSTVNPRPTELLGGVEQLDRFRQQRSLVGHDLQLDPIGLQRLPGQLGSADGLERGSGSRRCWAARARRADRARPMTEPLVPVSTRRIATVHMAVPEATMVSSMTCMLGAPPVPRISRDAISVPAMTNGSGNSNLPGPR